MKPKIFIICEDTHERFQVSFNAAVEKIQAIGSGIHQQIHEFHEGKFIAFLSYSILERQECFDMSLPAEALRLLERNQSQEMYKKVLDTCHVENTATKNYNLALRKRLQFSNQAITARIEPVNTELIGKRKPTVLGRVWRRS